MRRGSYLPIFLVFFGSCLLLSASSAKAQGSAIGLTSPAFDHGAMIPTKYTCDGQNVSPPLEWTSVPTGTMSFAIICDDPDAPMGTWVHWIYYDIPANAKGLPEDVGPQEHPKCGGTQGTSDFGSIGYGGPCPPGGTHRYFFKSYALDVMLDLAPGATKSEVVKSMKGHILEKLELMGRYKRPF
jgi:Raf kinase inhibitor-like YbhB/YbcL family protein